MVNCVEIGMHKHGCCVMQRCLEKGTLLQKLALADYIIVHLNSLLECPYGNYLVQNVLKLNDREKNERVLANIATDFIRLSQLKFSSNVIEKCLDPSLAIDRSLVSKMFRGTLPHDDCSIRRELGSKVPLGQRVSFIV